MADRGPGTRVYHYIRDAMALCRGLGLYRGDLVPHAPGSPKGSKDCAKCFRILQAELKEARRAP